MSYGRVLRPSAPVNVSREMGHICLNCGHVDEDYDERPDEWRENDWDGWEDAPNHQPERMMR